MPDEEILFPEGNYADYWLGQPPGTNTFLSDDVGWLPMELLMRVQRRREVENWNSRPFRSGKEELNDDSFVAMMRAGGERGGGLQGGTPELLATRAALIRTGHQALAWERRLMQKA